MSRENSKEKTKRKANPRRRTLMRLIIGMGILIALITGAIQILRPSGAEIVYIAPDENNVEQVWLVNLNNPDNPRQLTEFEQNEQIRIHDLQSAKHTSIIVFQTYDGLLTHRFWKYDVQNNQLKIVLEHDCNSGNLCPRYHWDLHPSGEFLAYTYVSFERSLFILNVETLERRLMQYPEYQLSQFGWIDDSGLMFSIGHDDYQQKPVAYMRNITTDEIVGSSYVGRCQVPSPDGRWCATNLYGLLDPIEPELVSLLELSSSEQLFLPLDWVTQPLWKNTNIVTSYFHGWFPDSSRLLFSDYQYDFSRQSPEDSLIVLSSTLNLYDIEQQVQTPIITVSGSYGYSIADFNADGTQFIISRDSHDTYERQTILFDLETGEETIFPIAGRYPQWVNGGR